MKSITVEKDDIYITVDYRTELLGILMTISNYSQIMPQMFQDDFANDEYVNRIKEKFYKYNGSKIIKLFDELAMCGLTNNWMYDLFLSLNDDLSCSDSLQSVREKLNNDELLDEFLSLIVPFSQEIKFDEYYISNISEYTKYINSASRLIDGSISEFLGDYYGLDNIAGYKHIVNLLPYSTQVGYGTKCGNKLYVNRSVSKYGNDDDMFFDGEYGLDLRSNIIHELSHSYINSFIFLNEDTNSMLFDKNNLAKPLNYENEDDTTILCENMVRAIAARYIDRTYGADQYNQRINYEKNRNFDLVPRITQKISAVEDNELTIYDYYYELLSDLSNEMTL